MMILAVMMVMTISANAMSYKEAKNEALFLSDKMANELNLTDAQYDDVFEINLDYLMSVNGYNDAYGKWWNRRNNDLKYVLTAYQYEKYMKINYFYRPLAWEKGAWKGKANRNDAVYKNSSSKHRVLAQNNNSSRGNGFVRSGHR